MSVRLGVFDMDGTAYRNSLTIDLLDRLRAMGLLGHVNFYKVDEAKRRWKNREGDDTYETYLQELVRLLESGIFRVPVDVVSAICDQIVSEQGQQLYEFTRELIATLRELGYTLIAISGSPKPIVEAFVRPLGFHQVYATEYEVQKGRYTGKITALPVNDKAAVLRSLLLEYQASDQDLITVGDTLSDYGMLNLSRYAIAFNPSRALTHRVRQDRAGTTWRSLGVVIQRKDNITIATFHDNCYSGSRLVEVNLNRILPLDVADRLANRLGELYQYGA